MRRLLILLLLLSSCPVHAQIWKEEGFALHAGGWYSPALADQQGWRGLLLGLEMPLDGVLVMSNIGALEVYIPTKGWVPDDGIMIWDGCSPDAGMQDSLFSGVTVTEDMKCAKERNRVLMVARIPRNKTKGDTFPTKARWVTRREYHYVAHAESDSGTDDVGKPRVGSEGR